MPADDRTIAIAAALGLPVYRLRSISFGMSGSAMQVKPVYDFRDADGDRLVEVLALYAGEVPATAAAVVASDAEHF